MVKKADLQKQIYEQKQEIARLESALKQAKDEYDYLWKVYVEKILDKARNKNQVAGACNAPTL